MSRENNARSSLFGALFVPALILGALIIIAILIISFRGSAGGAPARGGRSDNSRQLDDAMLAKFRDQYDDLGVAVGDADAPVTIREFADYQCPACGAFAPTAYKIRENLVKSGKARFVFFDFPLPMHEHAQQAAVAARCAARQDQFWTYHDKLFETQDTWSDKDDPMSSFLDLAVETGVAPDRLQQCIEQGGPDQVIAQSREAGKAVGLRATPTVIVDHTLFSGAVSYDRIKQMADSRAGDAAN